MNTHSDAEVLALWQQQAREEQTVPLDDIRAKAQRLDAKSRRMRVWMTLFFILLLIKGAVEVWFHDALLERAGDLLLITALVYVAYRYRKQRLAAPPVALGRTNCVKFYRSELVRRRDVSKDSWGYLLPFVPGITLAILDGVLADRPTTNRLVLVLLGAALFLGIAWWNAHAARKLENEIRALDIS
jgi:hypothetical protein